jgi:hypothetical protein
MNDQTTAQTWRDLADLAAADALLIERLESRWIKGGAARANDPDLTALLLGVAKSKIAAAKNAEQFSHIPVPPGNPEVEQWEPLCAGGWTRQLSWASFEGEELGIDVEVAGEQDTSGGFTRSVTLWDLDGDRPRLTAAQARLLAANLLAAAHVMDRLDYDGLTKREQIAQLQQWADEDDALASISADIRDGRDPELFGPE